MTRTHFAVRAAVCALLTFAVPLAGLARPAQPAQATTTPERLGTVHFITSCDPKVEKAFDRAVALLHSFWFNAAIKAFEGVLAQDPACAMTQWGVAMSWWGNPFGAFRSPKALENGWNAVEKAKAIGAKTPRERAYIGAVEVLYRDNATVDQRTRVLAYEKAMERVAADYPEDSEARIFYALSLDQTALPSDKTYGNLLKAGAILEQEFPRMPDHPGVAHYIIHSYDVPPLASKALDAARRYGKIAAAAPHALHMPSHTFTRLGYWQESIDANLASAAAARMDNAAAEELHALDYQAYAYLQSAQDSAARKVSETTTELVAKIESVNAAGNAAPPPAGFFAAAAVPARYALERNAWSEAATLQVRESPFAWATAISHFARALGAARSGNPAAARKDTEQLGAIAEKLRAAKDAYWSEQADIQRRVAQAWIDYAEGRKDEAVAELRAAADAEDQTDKSAISPGPIRPARELLGEMLLDMNRPAEALTAFVETTKKEPNRFRGLYGAARAAELAGDVATARSYYSMLLEIGARADPAGRPELEQARKSK